MRIGDKRLQLAARLRVMADLMEQNGADMDYYGGLAEYAKHGKELIGAAQIARDWAAQIEEESR